MKNILVTVKTVGCLTRFRNGMQFTKTAKEIKVDEHELAVLEADSYLKVTVIDDGTETNAGADTTVSNASADPTTTDAEDRTDIESTDVSEEPDKRLDTLDGIVTAMRGLNLDMTGDKPSIKELKELGLDVSAKERDAVWDQLVAEHNDKSDA